MAHLKVFLCLLMLLAGLALVIFCVIAVLHYDPKKKYCDRDCEHCPFPPEDCGERRKDAEGEPGSPREG